MNATQLSLVDRRMLDAANRADRGEGVAAAQGEVAGGRVLELVWEANERRLMRLALGLGLSGEKAADVLQDVYVATIEKPPGISNESELLKWLFKVTVNRCHFEQRRQGRWRRMWSALIGAWAGDASLDRAVNDGELKAEVARALATLSAEDRSLVVMRYFSELNSREIGEICGMPEATVRSRLRAARRKLAEELAEWGGKDEG